jgi:hypothetical protein
MELAFVGMICACGGGVAILLALAAMLKLSAFVATRLAQPTQQETRRELNDWDWDDWDDEPGPSRSKPVIPVPGLAKCLAVMLITVLVAGLGYVLLGFFATEVLGLRMRRDESQLAVLILDLPFAFGILTMLLVALLPTTVRRAAMVTFIYVILFLAFAAAVLAMVFVFGVIFD